MRGMSRSDKGCAGSGEDGKVTSGQGNMYITAVRDDYFPGPGFVQIPLLKHKKAAAILIAAAFSGGERGI